MKATVNDLVHYINSGHPLDPAPVCQEREKLAALLAELGGKLRAGENFEFDLAGKIVVTADGGKIEVAIVASNDNIRTGRAGDICNALLDLDGRSRGQLRICPSCGHPFVSPKAAKKYCNEACARRAWNRNLKKGSKRLD